MNLTLPLSVMLVLTTGLALLPPVSMDIRSQDNLKGVQVELQAIAVEAYLTCPTPFIIIDGIRTIEEQREHVSNGASQTLRSKHLEGRAIDFVPTSFDWNDIDSFTKISECFKDVSPDLVWGGDWTTFRDYGHIELK